MKKYHNKINFEALYSFIINAIIMLFVILVFKVMYETSDDAIINQHITDGFYDIKFTNRIIAVALGTIQNIIYPINAYTVFFLALAYISFVTITKVFIEQFDIKKGIILTLIINGIFAVNYYSVISFTRLPGLVGTAGFLAIVHYSRRDKWLSGTVWGIILVITASLIRFNVFLLVFGTACAFVAAISFNDYFNIEKGKRKIVDLLKIILEPKRLVSAVLLIVICFSLNTVSDTINNKNEDYLNYSKYTSIRGQLYDYRLPSYEVMKQGYDSLDIDENDIEMLKYGFYDSDVAYPYEKLQELKEIVSNYNKENNKIVNTIKTMAITELSSVVNLTIEGIGLISLAVAIILYFILNNKKQYLSVLFIIIGVFVCYLYLFVKGRYVYRVLFPIIFSSFCYLVYLIDFSKIKLFEKSKNKILKNALIYSCVCAIFISSMILTSNKNIHIRDDYYPKKPSELKSYMSENNDKRFEILCGRVQYWIIDNVIDNVFLTKHLDYSVNYLESTGTYYGSDYYNERMRHFGTDNYYSNVLNDDVYVVVEKDESHYKNAEMMQKFLQKYYSDGKTVNQETVIEMTDYTVYNYTLS